MEEYRAGREKLILPRSSVRHAAYAAGWKKFEGLWNLLIRTKQVAYALPTLEGVLSGFGILANHFRETKELAPEKLGNSLSPPWTQEFTRATSSRLHVNVISVSAT